MVKTRFECDATVHSRNDPHTCLCNQSASFYYIDMNMDLISRCKKHRVDESYLDHPVVVGGWHAKRISFEEFNALRTIRIVMDE